MIKNLGVAAEYLATLKLYPYNSGYATAWQRDYVAMQLWGYVATSSVLQLQVRVPRWIHDLKNEVYYMRMWLFPLMV